MSAAWAIPSSQLREMVELPLRYPELFTRLGVDPPKGVLLHGPPGTGKTRLAQAVANESDADFFTINGPEIMGSAYGESEKRLREVFEEAERAAPAIVFIDEIDSIAPKRQQVSRRGGKAAGRAVADADGRAEARANLVVIAATNRPDAIDEALRRPGRFDREIVIGVPDEKGRREILVDPHPRHAAGRGRRPQGTGAHDAWLRRRRYRRAGARGGDRGGAADHAQDRSRCARRSRPKCSRNLRVETRGFPSRRSSASSLRAMREVMVQVPDVGWDDIGGVDEAQEQLQEGVELPLKNPQAFRAARHPPGQGLPALRPARHRQDAAGQGGGQGSGSQFHLDQELRPAVANGTARASSRSPACSPAPARSRRA